MSLRGIEFHPEETPQAIVKSSDGSLSLKTNKGTVDGFTHVMFATGRRPNTAVKISHVFRLRLQKEYLLSFTAALVFNIAMTNLHLLNFQNLGLEAVGVKMSKNGAIEVSSFKLAHPA